MNGSVNKPGGSMGLREWCKSRGVPPSSLHKALDSGKVVRLPDGSVDVVSADEWLSMRNAKREGGVTSPRPVRQPRRNGAPRRGSVAAAQRALVAGRAALVRLELRRRRGELIEAKEVEQAAFDAARRVRDLLLSVPARLAPVVAGLAGNQQACYEAIQGEMYAACDELSVKRRTRKGEAA